MRHGSLLLAVCALLMGCSGAGLGDACGGTDDCGANLQCLSNVCVARCVRAPDCGDGYSCDTDGICHAATGGDGDACTSETQCEEGYACRLSATTSTDGSLGATCSKVTGGHPAGAACALDDDCANHTCALGRCVDLCDHTLDCGVGMACTVIPRIESDNAMFQGCLQSTGSLAWTIPIHGSSDTVKLPVPASARSIAVTMRVDDPNQMVGVTKLTAPDGTPLLQYGDDPYADKVRHLPLLGQSVLALPSSPDTLIDPSTKALVPGGYTMTVSSLKPPFDPTSVGTATPVVTAVAKLDASVILDLHFYFLDFTDHPCNAQFGAFQTLDATTAAQQSFFQSEYIGQLRTIFSSGGVALGTLTYKDLPDHHDLDGLDLTNAGDLLQLGEWAGGVNVFFVRTISPGGIQAFGPNPGPAGIAGTSQSGVIVSLESLCYSDWKDIARITAREVARYMGLYNNVEIDATQRDPIMDSDDSSSNLMFYSELGGIDLSDGQHQILNRSPVLR
ncbi:MAG: hypothetical protein QM831_18985 [Kofleriaceae bacterium]